MGLEGGDCGFFILSCLEEPGGFGGCGRVVGGGTSAHVHGFHGVHSVQ